MVIHHLYSDMSINWNDFCLDNGIRKYLDCDIKNLDHHVEVAHSLPKNLWPVLFKGDCGLGKTYLMMVIMKSMMEKGIINKTNFRYLTAQQIERELLKFMRDQGEQDYFINKFIDLKYLFVDELGYNKPLPFMRRFYYDLIELRAVPSYFTLITTNLGEAQVTEFYGKSVASRLKEFCHIEFDGNDRRKFNSKKYKVGFNGKD